MNFAKLLGALVIRVFLLGLALGLGLAGSMVAVSAASDGILSSLKGIRDIVFTVKATCKGDTLGCADTVNFNGKWIGIKLCRAGRCKGFEEVFGDR